MKRSRATSGNGLPQHIKQTPGNANATTLGQNTKRQQLGLVDRNLRDGHANDLCRPARATEHRCGRICPQ
jgi:hypothetical protein